MRKRVCLPHVLICAILALCFGCGAPQIQGGPADSVKTCIQGKVWMKSPVDSAQVAYGGVGVTAWRHDKDLPIGETKADSEGNYCIEVPVGGFRVDLRVWGMERAGEKNHICQGSAENVDPGKTPKRCGEECLKADILALCEERAERRIGK